MGYLSCNAASAIATCDPYYCHLKNKNNHKHSKNLPQIREFHYADLLAATNAFSADTFLGKGSHGSVYKATLDAGKLIAAVKKTKPSKPTAAATSSRHHTTCTGCGNCTSPAENEIEILSRVANPRRLVNLIGFCTDPNGTKLIVVEYMPNGSLHDLLHSPVRPPGWTARVRFALHVAKAVHALHSANPPVIHRDIKSSNVLIDGGWNARLGDFGLALRGHVEDVRVKCTPPAGTLGYLDPCYLAPEDLSAKSDVFSFGILLLEIVSGRNAIDVNYSPPSVVDWAVPLIRRGELIAICDRRIGAPSDAAVIGQVAVLAARCVRSRAEKRPSMEEVVECLKAVRKRMRASRIWRGLRGRVGRVESEKALGKWECESCDYYYDRRSEEVGVTVSSSSSRRNRRRKVSSVTGVEYEQRGPSSNHQHHHVRSKSIGAAAASSMSVSVSGIIRMNSNSDSGRRQNQVGSGLRRKKGPGRGMRLLSKSRSMGVLQGGAHGHGSGTDDDPVHSLEMAMSKWAITHDDKLENKLLETPLVS